MGEVDKLSVKKNLNNLCRYFAPKEIELNYPSLRCGMGIMGSFPKFSAFYRKRRKRIITQCRKPNKH